MTEVQIEDFEEDGMRWLTANRTRVKAKTTGRRLTSLRAFARWAGWGTSQLADYICPTPVKGQPHPLPEGIEGVRRMIAAAKKDQHKALVTFGGFMGMRIAESLSVRPSHFNLDDMTCFVTGKGAKDRIVPVTDETWSIIQMPVMHAFISGEDLPVVGLRDRFARSVVTNLAERANLSRRVASHDLRATAATVLYDRTLDQRLVQEFLGHASADQTSIYIGVAQNKMRKGLELL